MTNKPTVTIGIPAHNEEKNIALLLRDLLSQNQSRFSLDRIIIINDGSTDKTSQEVKNAADFSLINLIEHEKRLGIARTANELFEKSEADILVFLNADVSVPDSGFIEKITAPIIEGGADLTSGALEEMPPKTLVEKVLWVSMDCKKNAFTNYNQGDNLYTCHGPMRAFSKRLYKKMRLNRNIADDMYSYFFAKKCGLAYAFVPEAVAYYKLPDTLGDHIRQSIRFFKSPNAVRQEFSKEFVKTHSKFPKSALLKSALREFTRHPLLFSLYIPLAIITKIISLFKPIEKIEKEWGSAPSSKNLH